MADPTINSAVLLCSAKGNAAGQIQWWLFNVDVADAATSINVNTLVSAGPGNGSMIALVDGGAADSGKGAMVLDGATTGLALMSESHTEIKFINTQNGANGATQKDAIGGLDLVVTFAV